jgi:hypothetical protein
VALAEWTLPPFGAAESHIEGFFRE